MNALDPLHDARTLALVTFRRNGQEVATPVNFVIVERRLYVDTRAGSWKVKRLRNDPRVRMAPCTMRGRVTGAWVEGTGRILAETPLAPRIHVAMGAKYGWPYRLAAWWRNKRGRRAERILLEITVRGG